jgi:hypothetical protein
LSVAIKWIISKNKALGLDLDRREIHPFSITDTTYPIVLRDTTCLR